MTDSEAAGFITHLTKCLAILQEVENSCRFKDTFVLKFKSFLQHFSLCLEEIRGNLSLIHKHPLRSKILLCFSQVIKTLVLLNSIGDGPYNLHTVWCLCQRLHWCFSELCQILNGSLSDQDQESDILSSFLRKIDLALSLLQTQNEHNLKLWKQIVDDLVYQAITIAKIGSATDYKEITSACQTLLREGSQLINETPSNLSQLTLLTDSLTSGLASLEERVNIAVLRLMLKVSCDSSKPLKQLVQHYGQSDTASTNSAADLDQLIAEFDAHMERILLTGQFATTCCEDVARVAEMRCCLASLEWLDNYLVPALRAFHLSPHCQAKRNFAQFLCNHWQDQLASLKTILDAVVDSYAYIQIVLNDLNELHGNLQRGVATKDESDTTVKQCWVLYRHLSKTLDSSQNAVDLMKLKQVVYEYDTAVYNGVPARTLLKRVQHLISAISSVSDKLATSADRSAEDEEYNLHSTAEGSIAINNTVAQFGTDENIQMKEQDVDLLAPYLNQTSRRHTTLYERTPRKTVESRVMDSDIDSALGITDILENLTILSIASSFNKDIASSAERTAATSTGEGGRHLPRKLFSSRSTFASVDGSQVTDVSTLTRLEDLRFLDEKLEHLKQV